MIDIKLIIENPEYVKNALKKRNWDFDPKEIVDLNIKRKKIIKKIEKNRHEHKIISNLIQEYKKNNKNFDFLLKKAKKKININKKYEILLKEIQKKIYDIIVYLPNLPDNDVSSGGKENNKVIEIYGEKRQFNFKIKDHVYLAKTLKLIDFDHTVKISGEGTWTYINEGAELEWALLNYFVSENLKNNYCFILPPHMLNENAGFGAGIFPKFYDSVFKIDDKNKFLIPTAETMLVNFHYQEILKEKDLPKKYFSYTPCYRKEAGNYRTEERGTIRGYQFNKVEIVQFTKDNESDKVFEEMINNVISVIKKIGLHFRLSKLAASDCSHSMVKTYDAEVYLPSLNIYKEISSISNARDYQTRRNMTRYKDINGKIHFCHTLNASCLATSRIFPAILEQFQQEDGSVIIPEVLRPFMRNKKIIYPKKNE